MPKLSSLVPALAVLTLGSVALVSYASDTEDKSSLAFTEAVSTTSSVEGAPTTSAPAGVTPLGVTNLSRKTERPAAPSQLVVTDVRVGNHNGFERVVFEFTGEGSPGWFIDYTDKPLQQGSGNAIDYEGATALNVNIDGTVYPFEKDMADPNLGSTPGAGGFITEVKSSGTFEGRSQFVVGLKERHPYSVQVLEEPTRLVIDFLAAT